MHTGDLAVMADDGYVNIVGRIKDMVIRGGENVYPREIEEFLYTHPAVADVQVIGVPDAKYGEELMAWVKLRPGTTADEDELREFCRGTIAHFKIPRYIRFVDDYPMTVTGKVQKFLMREQSIAELGFDRRRHRLTPPDQGAMARTSQMHPGNCTEPSTMLVRTSARTSSRRASHPSSPRAGRSCFGGELSRRPGRGSRRAVPRPRRSHRSRSGDRRRRVRRRCRPSQRFRGHSAERLRRRTSSDPVGEVQAAAVALAFARPAGASRA